MTQLTWIVVTTWINLAISGHNYCVTFSTSNWKNIKIQISCNLIEILLFKLFICIFKIKHCLFKKYELTVFDVSSFLKIHFSRRQNMFLFDTTEAKFTMDGASPTKHIFVKFKFYNFIWVDVVLHQHQILIVNFTFLCCSCLRMQNLKVRIEK